MSESALMESKDSLLYKSDRPSIVTDTSHHSVNNDLLEEEEVEEGGFVY